MNCMNCGAVLTDADFCTGCGADVLTYKKIMYHSNACYNDGLSKAQVRDLSGAAVSLSRSLKYNKRNIPARNLLGLVYFAQGEVVSALTEWIISKNIQSEKNIASRYIEQVQSNQSKLNVLNQTIKKYNIALNYSQQGSDDLAIIQLKKILGTNPNLLKGHQLIAMLYMKNEEYDKANQYLQKAIAIDAANTITLKLLHEAGGKAEKAPAEPKKKKIEQISYQHGNETIIQPPLRKDYSALTTVLHIFLGIIVGIAATWFLILPNIQAGKNSSNNDEVKRISQQLSEKDERISSLENELESAQGETQSAKDQAEQTANTISSYTNLISVAKSFFDDGSNEVDVYNALAGIDEGLLTEEGKELYNAMKDTLGGTVAETLYREGKLAHDRRNNEEAVEKLTKVVEFDEEYQNGDALYYLGRSYERMENTEKAVETYSRFLELFGNNAPKRARTAQQYVDSASDTDDDNNNED